MNEETYIDVGLLYRAFDHPIFPLGINDTDQLTISIEMPKVLSLEELRILSESIIRTRTTQLSRAVITTPLT